MARESFLQDREVAQDPSIIRGESSFARELVARRMAKRSAQLDLQDAQLKVEKARLKAEQTEAEEGLGAKQGVRAVLAARRAKHTQRLAKMASQQGGEQAKPQPAPQIPEIPIDSSAPKAVPGFAQKAVSGLIPGGPQNVQEGGAPSLPAGGVQPAPPTDPGIRLGGGPTGLQPSGMSETSVVTPEQTFSGVERVAMAFNFLRGKGGLEEAMVAARGSLPEQVRTTRQVLYPEKDELVQSLASLRYAEQTAGLQPGTADQYLDRLQSQLGAEAASGIALEARGRAALIGQARRDTNAELTLRAQNDLIEKGFGDSPQLRAFTDALYQNDWEEAIRLRTQLGTSPAGVMDLRASRIRMAAAELEMRKMRQEMELVDLALLQAKVGDGATMWDLVHPGERNPYMNPQNPLAALARSRGQDPSQIDRESAVKLLQDTVAQGKGLGGGIKFSENPAAWGQFQEAGRVLFYNYGTVALLDPEESRVHTIPVSEITGRVATLSGILTEQERVTPVELGGLSKPDGTLDLGAMAARRQEATDYLASIGLESQVVPVKDTPDGPVYNRVLLRPAGEIGEKNRELLSVAGEAASILATQLPSRGVGYEQIEAALLRVEQSPSRALTPREIGEAVRAGVVGAAGALTGVPRTIHERMAEGQAAAGEFVGGLTGLDAERGPVPRRGGEAVGNLTEQQLWEREMNRRRLREMGPAVELSPEAREALRQGRTPPGLMENPQMVPGEPGVGLGEREAKPTPGEILRERWLRPPEPRRSRRRNEGRLEPGWLYPPTVFPRGR